jgi:ABC-type transport system involved in multi-copper enzyme maturation permease subunit
MVVKELRQGLRTRMFGLVMVLLHVHLVLFTLMGGGSGNAELINTWFDGIINLTLCVILPLRGFSAVADELKAGTLDMLALTSLSAGRIIFGKWASIVAQSLLIAFSILPYVVARYVFGGLDLFGEVAMLFYKWLGGAVMAAVIIALSTQRQFWLRAFIVGVPMLIGGCGMFSFLMVRGFGGPAGVAVFGMGRLAGAPMQQAAMALGLAAWLVFYFLSLAATRIAPAASMLSVVKRSIHFAALVILLILAQVTGTGGAAMATVAAFLWLVKLDALTEHVNEVPVVYAAFYRHGWAGRLALVFLAPGWVTGFAFTVLLTALVACSGPVEQGLLVLVSACGTWMIATLVQLLPARRARDLLLPFICMAIGVGLVLSMMVNLLVMPFAMKGNTAWFTAFIPQFVPVGYSTAKLADKKAFLDLALGSALVWPALLALLAVLALRRTAPARREAWVMVKGGAD